MGIKGKDILRGVGHALSKRGERRREDERIEKEDDLKERELSLRENESKLRVQQMEITNHMNNAKIAHGNLVKTAMSSGYTTAETGYGSEAMASALTKYVKDGRAYQHKGFNKDGIPIWSVGTYKTAADGKMEQDPSTGKPIFEALPGGGEKSWGSAQDYTNFISSNMNPDYLFAMQLEDRTYAQTRRDVEQKLKDDITREKALGATPTGQRGAAAVEAKTDLDVAKAEKYRAEAAGVGKGTKAQAKVSKRQGIAGAVERTAKESDNDKAEFAARAKNMKLSLDQSYKISEVLGGNKKVAAAFHSAVKDALKTPAAREQFIREATGPKVGLPLSFVEDLLTEAEEMGEVFAKAKEDALPSLWQRFKNSLVGGGGVTGADGLTSSH